MSTIELKGVSKRYGEFTAVDTTDLEIGQGELVTLLGPMVMQWFAKEEMPIVNAFNNVAVNTGITITHFTTVPLASAFGWRNTLLAYGLLSVALLVAWAVLGKDKEAPKAKAESGAPAD